jgi:hypothetical protein
VDSAGLIALGAADGPFTIPSEDLLHGAIVDKRGESAHLEAGVCGVWDAIEDGTAGNGGDIHRQGGIVIGELMQPLNDFGELDHGVGAAPVLTACVGAPTFHFYIEGGAALSRDDQGEGIAFAAIGFEDKARARALREMLAANFAKVARDYFLAGTEEQDPVCLRKDAAAAVAEGGEDKVHQGGATLDIVRARSVDAIAVLAPVKVISLLLLLRVDRIEMGDHGDGRCARDELTSENEMAPVSGIRRLDERRFEAKGREVLRDENTEPVHPVGILSEAIDFDHLPEELERLRQASLTIGSELFVIHRADSGRDSEGGKNIA